MSSRVEKLKKKLAERNAQRGPSPLELWVQEWLPLAKLYDYETEFQVDKCFIDIAWPIQKVALELDGYQFHKDRVERDSRRDAFLEGQGWTVYRIPSRHCWNPRLLAPHLWEVFQLINPGRPFPLALQDLMPERQRPTRATERRHYLVGKTSYMIDVTPESGSINSLANILRQTK